MKLSSLKTAGFSLSLLVAGVVIGVFVPQDGLRSVVTEFAEDYLGDHGEGSAAIPQH